MSKMKSSISNYGHGDGAGLLKRRIRCDKCSCLIDDLKKACPRCGCMIFTMPNRKNQYSRVDFKEWDTSEMKKIRKVLGLL